jgi:protein-L-isoaspartate O-methyltransferase
MMVQALKIEDGHWVPQVATGTGYTAALLCERLGSEQATSIDVNPDLTTTARDRLRHCGYTPTVITADGAHGYPDHAPYDRILVTFAVTSIPPAWIDQTRAGGVISAPVFSGLAKLTVTGQGTAQGPFIGPGYFMRHRAIPNASPDGRSVAVVDEQRWPQRTTNLPSSVYYDNDFRFLPDRHATTPTIWLDTPEGNHHTLLSDNPTGSDWRGPSCRPA